MNLENSRLYTRQKFLPRGFNYIFTINDSYGDGICCGNGIGWYNLSVDGIVVASSRGEYDRVETKRIFIGACNG